MTRVCKQLMEIGMSIFIVFLAALPAFSAKQVVTSAVDSVDGSLRSAIGLAAAGDTVVFNIPGKDTVVIKDSITLDKNIVILGGANQATNNRLVASVDSQSAGKHGVFKISGGNSVIHGLMMLGKNAVTSSGYVISATGKGTIVHLDSIIISGWKWASGGVCISNSADSLTIRNSIVTNNSCGGIENETGVLTVINVTISKNYSSSGSFMYGTAVSGGGLYNYAGIVRIDSSRIDSNSCNSGYYASAGGGICNSSGSVTIANTEINGNSSYAQQGVTWGGSSEGGGIYNDIRGYMTVTNCAIVNNISRAGGSPNEYGGTSIGGGICNSGVMILTNSAVSFNYSSASGGSYGGSSSGGGVYNNGLLTITNSVIDSNASYGYGGDSYGGSANGGGVCNTARLTIINGTIWGNTSHGSKGTSYGGNSIGGGIFNQSGVMTLAFSTVGNNKSSADNGNPFPGSASCNDIYDRQSFMVNSIIFGEYADSSKGKSHAVNIYTGSGLPANKINCLSGTSAWELFGVTTPKPANNGGPTQTIAIDSASIARKTGLRAGTYGKDTTLYTHPYKIIQAAYFNGTSWLSLETDSVIPPATLVTEITTDARGVLRGDPPCRGSYEYVAGMASTINRGAIARPQAIRFLGTIGSRLQLVFPLVGNYEIKLFDIKGQLIERKIVYSAGGLQEIHPSRPLARGLYHLMINGCNLKAVSKVFIL